MAKRVKKSVTKMEWDDPLRKGRREALVDDILGSLDRLDLTRAGSPIERQETEDALDAIAFCSTMVIRYSTEPADALLKGLFTIITRNLETGLTSDRDVDRGGSK